MSKERLNSTYSDYFTRCEDCVNFKSYYFDEYDSDCGVYPPIFCDEMKKDYFVYGLCKKHKQIQKSNRRYGDE